MPSWQDVRKVVEFKTFYLALVLVLLGTVLLLAEVRVSAWLPALKGVSQGLGLTLVTSATVSVLTESFLRLDIIELVAGRLRDINQQLLLDNGQGNHPELERFLHCRNDLDFNGIVKEAHNEVLICGVSANDVLSVQLLHTIEDLMRQRAALRFRIVLLNPWSVGAALRAGHPAYKRTRQFHEKCAANLNALLDFQDRVSQLPGTSRFEVRLTHATPSTSTVITEQRVVLTPLLTVITGGRAPTLIFRRDAGAGGTVGLLLQEFEAQWATAFAVSRATLNDAEAEGDRQLEALVNNPERKRIAVESGVLLVR